MARRARRGLALLALLGAGAGVLVLRARRTPPLPPPAPLVVLPGNPRLVPTQGGTLRHGADAAPERTLQPGRWVLGRDRASDLHLDDTTVSPRHALLDVDGEGRVVVHDLGALNGVQVDGVPVAEAELHDGNRLSLGDVQMVYRVDPVGDSGGRQGGELGEQAEPEGTVGASS